MNNKSIEEFRKQYKIVYKGILPDEILDKGNDWFEEFLTKAIQSAKKEAVEDIIHRIEIDEKIAKNNNISLTSEHIKEIIKGEFLP